MRLLRPVTGPLVGLLAGYLAGVVAALWLRASAADVELIWNRISPLRIGAWVLTAAHGVPLSVRSVAGVRAPDGGGSVDRLGDLLGGSSEVAFGFSVFLVPITVLALVGIVTAAGARRARPSTPREALVVVAASAVTHGLLLGLAARSSGFTAVLEGRLAPDLGLGAATGHVGIAIGAPALAAVAIGAVWGAACSAAGAFSVRPMRRAIGPGERVVLLGWLRGFGVASAVVAGALLLGGLGALVTGRAPSPSLIGLGAMLLSGNAVAAVLVASNGVPMSVALDAGPFTGWERVDLLSFGTASEAAPAVLWLVLVLPIVAGVVAGRFVRRRSASGVAVPVLRLGALWGLSMAVLAMLVRVRVLSSFSVGGLDLGGGSASFDPLVALVVGAVVGTVAAAIGVGSVRSGRQTWTCAMCGITNTDEDRFCVSCGAAVQPAGTIQSGA